ncbi:unnamed protein product [Sympodiomycopsis kandeliae]
MAVTDSRFDTSQWSEGLRDDAGPSRTSLQIGPGSQEPDDEEVDGEEDSGASEDEDEDVNEDEDDRIIKGLSAKELEAFERKQRKRGIIYISRIPPGMTVPKVRHLLSGFGEVERIFLHDSRKKEKEAETGRKNSKRNTQFTEGWVEFSKKSVAKIVAQTLNAQPIGFSSGGKSANKNARRWQDDVWTMKYLSGFKWHMLNEQMAHERAAHASRLRTELSQSKFEQQDYLRKVERARVQRDKEQKRIARAEKSGMQNLPLVDPSSIAPGGKIRTFKQRQPVVRDVRDQRDKSKKRSHSAGGDEEGQSRKSSKNTSNAPASNSSSALSGVLSKIF